MKRAKSIKLTRQDVTDFNLAREKSGLALADMYAEIGKRVMTAAGYTPKPYTNALHSELNKVIVKIELV